MHLFSNPDSKAPRAMRGPQVDRVHGHEVKDPYRWLEDIEASETQTWIESQRRHTDVALSSIPFREALRARVDALSQYETVGMPVQEGDRLFFTRQRPGAQQASLVWCENGSEETRTLLDPSDMAPDATVSIMGFKPSPSGRYVAYGLSQAGSDWQTWRVIDVDTGQPLPDELHWIRFTSIGWREDESGFFYTGSEPPPADAVYKAPTTARTVRFHRLGHPQTEDAVIFARQDEPNWMSYGQVTSDDRYLIITTQRGTHRQNRVAVLDLLDPGTGPVHIIPEFSASFLFLGSVGERLFFWTNDAAPRGRIIGIDLSQSPGDDWVETVAEGSGVITGAAFVGSSFVVSSLVNAVSRVRVHPLSEEAPYDVDLPGMGTVVSVDGPSCGPKVFLSYHAVAQPSIILSHNVDTRETCPFRRQHLPFDPAAFVTEQTSYVSEDGTVIPLFLSRKKATAVTPDTPTCLYGYGGFNLAQSPGFRLDHLAWMDMGGQLAVACIRGGGEFGTEWHQAGVGKNRPNVFTDFIAAAEWLISHQRTTTPRLVIQGRSNGGLLVGACMTKRPDLFGVCLPTVGVLDMLRFHKFTVGAFWTSDYGSPEDPQMLPVLLSYSPLHNVRPGIAYPPTLIMTGDHDDRVFPAHSFKFAAALQHAQAGDAPILLRVDQRAGHGLGKPKRMLLDEISDAWAFAFAAMGVLPILPA